MSCAREIWLAIGHLWPLLLSTAGQGLRLRSGTRRVWKGIVAVPVCELHSARLTPSLSTALPFHDSRWMDLATSPMYALSHGGFACTLMGHVQCPLPASLSPPWCGWPQKTGQPLCRMWCVSVLTAMGQSARHLARSYPGGLLMYAQQSAGCAAVHCSAVAFIPKGLGSAAHAVLHSVSPTAIGTCLARLHDCMQLLPACWGL